LKILIASTSLISRPVINTLRNDSQLSFQGVITFPNKTYGRGQKNKANPLTQWCLEQDISVFQPDNDEELADLLKSQNVDLVITIAFGKLIPQHLLSIPTHGWLNIHFSKLPRWRGAAPVQRAILSGDKSIGITIFKLDEGMDTGPVYEFAEYPLAVDATTSKTLNFLSNKAESLIHLTLEKIVAGINPVEQDEQNASIAHKFSKDDGLIEWGNSSNQIDSKFRALYENPGIWSKFRGIRIKINKMSVSPVNLSLDPGVVTFQDDKLYVGTSDVPMEIENLTPAGRSPMSGSEFFRGLVNRSDIYFG
jgi:methionyl-tRNA formyltransferase